MTNITMYNMQFGECIKLERNNRTPILSDFGSNWNSSDIENIYKKVISDLGSTPLNVYLSHFHNDHISGLLYMKANKIPFNINKFIIPDINNLSILKALFSESIIRQIFEKVIVSNRAKTSLRDFIDFFHLSVGNVVFSKRGDQIDGNTILWPDTSKLEVTAVEFLMNSKTVFNFIREKFEIDFESSISELSELIKIYFNENFKDSTLYHECEDKIKKIENSIKSMNYGLKDLYEIMQYFDCTSMNSKEYLYINDEDSDLSEIIIEEFLSLDPLNKLGHGICLVYHNTEYCDRNYIFTGDIMSKDLNYILQNKDSKCDVHKIYQYIKVPHHGTNARVHAVDFKSYMDESSILIISNGKRGKKVYKSGGKTTMKPSSKTWCIDQIYYENEYVNFSHFCSNINNCNGKYRKTCCRCKKQIRNSNLYKNAV